MLAVRARYKPLQESGGKSPLRRRERGKVRDLPPVDGIENALFRRPFQLPGIVRRLRHGRLARTLIVMPHIIATLAIPTNAE